jgi:hypothetical protein
MNAAIVLMTAVCGGVLFGYGIAGVMFAAKIADLERTIVELRSELTSWRRISDRK